jgi:hypothetical protein
MLKVPPELTAKDLSMVSSTPPYTAVHSIRAIQIGSSVFDMDFG